MNKGIALLEPKVKEYLKDTGIDVGELERIRKAQIKIVGKPAFYISDVINLVQGIQPEADTTKIVNYLTSAAKAKYRRDAGIYERVPAAERKEVDMPSILGGLGTNVANEAIKAPKPMPKANPYLEPRTSANVPNTQPHLRLSLSDVPKCRACGQQLPKGGTNAVERILTGSRKNEEVANC